jgi:PrgI family protein
VAYTHEVPNHLNVDDTLLLGLTARQVATFMAFASPAYGIWDQLPVESLMVRGTLAAVVVLVGIAFTLVQPGRRPLDEWAFAIFAHTIAPRRLRWCRPEPDPGNWCSGGSSGWADLAPRLGWGSGALDADDEASVRL